MRNVYWIALGLVFGFAFDSSADSILHLDAAKYYRPVKYEDGIFRATVPIEAVIPKSVPVTSGNAGNKLLMLSFDGTECLYKGGSKKANPLSGRSSPAEISAGTKYDHFLCVPSLLDLLSRLLSRKPLVPKPGEVLKVKNRIVLRVLDGDSSQPTKVRASITIKGSVEPPRKLLSLTAPANGSGNSSEPTYLILGAVDPSASGPRVVLSRTPKIYDGEPDDDISLNPDRTFSQEVSLVSGPNRFSISLYQGANLTETTTVELNYTPTGDSVSFVTVANGGNLEVTDSTLTTHGTRWVIPAGAASRDFYASIHDDQEHWSILPQDVIPVGTGATFFPISEEFTRNATFYLPVKADLLPQGRALADVEVYALDSNPETGRDFWKPLTVVFRANGSVAFESNNVMFYAVVPVVKAVVAPGELKIFSNAPATEVYVDGLPLPGVTPLTVKDLAPGLHQIKAFAPGYNEILRTITTAQTGDRVDLDMVPSSGNAPVVTIDASILNEMTVDQSIATIPGKVSGFGEDASEGFLIVSRNGFDTFAQPDSDGNFSHVVPLRRGMNQLVFRYTSASGVTGVSRTVRIMNDPIDFSDSSLARARSLSRQSIPHPRPPSKAEEAVRKSKKKSPSGANTLNMGSSLLQTASGKDIRITLTWNSATDIDLHVTDPFGNVTSYENPTGIPGSLLDVDDVDGFGPEIFTLSNAPVGDYIVQAHHYDDYGRGPGTATIQVDLAGKTVFSGSAGLFNNQWWNAYRIEVRESSLRILGVDLRQSFDVAANTCYQYGLVSGDCAQYAFTTATGENLVKIRAEASPDIDPNTIKYRVTNLMDFSPVSLTSGTGSTLIFPASNRPLSGLTSPPSSRAIVYQVIAFTDIGTESEPIYIAQDVRSQIRQEFIDKRRFVGSNFQRETPVYSAIADGSFYGPTFLVSPLAGADQHFAKYGLTIVRQSRTFYDRLVATGIPARLTSHWRNPRYNDSLGASNDSSVNSFHQTGDALDINPFREKQKWPSGSKTYEEARIAIRRAALRLLINAKVIDHGSGTNLHVHIEPLR